MSIPAQGAVGAETMTGTLWCMHISGPDDVHAAPDFWTALSWAAELNAAVAARAIKQGWAGDDNWPLAQATVQRWPWSAERHADSLATELAARASQKAALASPRADSDERTAGAKAVSARTLAGMLRSRIERAAEHKSETVSLGQFFADQIHRYLTEAGHGPEHDARIGDVPADGGDPDCDSGRDWGLRARQVHLEALSKRAAGGKWFASTNGTDGLARLDNGTDGMFPVRGEWHEIEFIEALVNAYRSGDFSIPAPPAGGVPDSLRALSEAASQGPWRLEPATAGFRAPAENDAADMMIVAADSLVPGVLWDASYIDAQKANIEFTVAAVNFVRSLLASHPAGQSAGSGAIERSVEQRAQDSTTALADHNKPAPDSTRTGDEGTVAVPVEPTDGMQQDGLAALEAAIRTHGKPSLPGFAAAHVYRAMIAARPAAPEAQGAWSFDMEAAPRDGSDVEVVNDRGQFIAQFDRSWGRSYADAGWWMVSDGKDPERPLRGDEPFAWRIPTKAPAPPASSGQGGR